MVSLDRRIFRPLLLLPIAVMLLISGAWASPRSDAWNLRRSDPQAALRGLNQVVRDDANDAKAQWFRAMILNDLGRGSEGLQALESAKRIDPSLSFSSNPQGVDNLARSLNRKTGGANNGGGGRIAVPPRERFGGRGGVATGGSGLNQADILKELAGSGVWVSPGMQSQANATEIQNAVRGTSRPVKVVVMDRMPPNTGNIGRFALSLHKFVFPRDKSGLVIVITGQPRNVAIYGGDYLYNDPVGLKRITDGAVNTMGTKGIAAGVSQIITDFDAAEASSERTGSIGLLVILGVPTAGAIWWIRRRNTVRVADRAKLRAETREMSSKLAPQYEKLDSDFEYAIIGESDPARKQQLQEMHARAGAAFSGAMKQLNGAEETPALAAGKRALINAQTEMQRAQNVLDGKPIDAGITQSPPAMTNGQGQNRLQSTADDNFEIPPLGAGYAGARNGYALDFFTSEPIQRDMMVPVDIEIDGQRRRVWASPQSAQRALNGQAQIATVDYNGQQTPWYGAPQRYNPWNDFGSTMLNMMAMNMMINAMMPHHYGHGYGGDTIINNNYGDGNSSGNWDNRGDSHSGYDNRVDAAPDYGGAGVSSFDSPFAGGETVDSGYDGSAGVSSLDLFGSSNDSGSSWGSDSS